MGKRTLIGCVSHTAVPWVGCKRCSSGCVNCYAHMLIASLVRHATNPDFRYVTSPETWVKLLTWNRNAGRAGVRRRVMTSMCDVFEYIPSHNLRDNKGKLIMVPSMDNTNTIGHHPSRLAKALVYQPVTVDFVRACWFDLMRRCDNLDFIVPTKRPQNVCCAMDCVIDMQSPVSPGYERHMFENVWLAISVSDQEMIRDTELALERMCMGMHFWRLGLFVEPLLERVDITPLLDQVCDFNPFVVVGGETGTGFRECSVDDIRDVVQQCYDYNVPVRISQDCGRKMGMQGRIPDALWNSTRYLEAIE